jgi:hypothetical protein
MQGIQPQLYILKTSLTILFLLSFPSTHYSTLLQLHPLKPATPNTYYQPFPQVPLPTMSLAPNELL